MFKSTAAQAPSLSIRGRMFHIRPWSFVLTASQGLSQSRGQCAWSLSQDQLPAELGFRGGTCQHVFVQCRDLSANARYHSHHSTVFERLPFCPVTTLYLVHHGGFLPVRLPFHSLVTVVDGEALHVHFRGEGFATLRNNRSYLLDFEQIDL